jgi:hypothetical protein
MQPLRYAFLPAFLATLSAWADVAARLTVSPLCFSGFHFFDFFPISAKPWSIL